MHKYTKHTQTHTHTPIYISIKIIIPEMPLLVLYKLRFSVSS